MGPALCAFGGSQYLIIGPNVAPLIYYSHLPIIVISLGLAIFILFKKPKDLSSQVLFGTILFFCIWVFCDLVFWASNRSDVIMLVWTTTVLVEPLVHIGGLYLLYTIVDKVDMPFKLKVLFFVLYLPIILSAPTHFMLTGFDTGSCLAIEGFIARYYSYALEIFTTFLIVLFGARRLFSSKYKNRKPEVAILTIGVLLLCIAFSWGNLIGSFTDNWQVGEYGLFGMPVFIGFLVWSIVRYKTFNLQIIGSLALVVGLIGFTFSLLFVENPVVFRRVAIVTFIFSLGFGYLLIRSVNREVKQREQIEKLADGLQKANAQQVVLIHFITHQIKGFLTKSRNIFSMAVEGEFGQLPEAFIPMAQEGLRSDTQAVTTVQEILNASNVKSGAVTYSMQPFDFGALVKEVFDGLKPAADAKKLELKLEEDGGPNTLTGDKLQLQNAIKNLIDNSIKYTPSGSVSLKLSKEGEKLRLTIQDTGVGITPEDMAHLFTEGGHGKDSIKVNVDSTGFGLYIVKNIIEAHHGKVWVESEGAGKGSTFIVELPTNLEVTAMPVGS
jgi:signal transduction histidine kinase